MMDGGSPLNAGSGGVQSYVLSFFRGIFFMLANVHEIWGSMWQVWWACHELVRLTDSHIFPTNNYTYFMWYTCCRRELSRNSWRYILVNERAESFILQPHIELSLYFRNFFSIFPSWSVLVAAVFRHTHTRTACSLKTRKKRSW